jgi:hypothetical protein
MSAKMTGPETFQSTPTQNNEDGRMRFKKIGTIDIDTGTVIIGDPCCVGEFLDLDPTTGKKSKKKEKCVLSSTGIGDGRYPVFAELCNDEQYGEWVAALHIHFYPDYCFADDPAHAAMIKKDEANFLREMNAF